MIIHSELKNNEENGSQRNIGKFLVCQLALDEALLLAEKISVEEEREQLRQSIMSIIADMYVETIRKIVIQHLDLDPCNNK